MKPGIIFYVAGLLLHPGLVLAQDGSMAEPEKAWYKSLVPVPVIITEPAIGEGLGVGVGYFHPQKSAAAYRPKTIENAGTVRDVSIASKPPPVVTGIFAAKTNNGTQAAGLGHMNTFRNDTIRYLGVAAYANVISKVYFFDIPFKFELEGALVYQDIKFRLGESSWFLGVGLSYLNARSVFEDDLDDIVPPEGVDRDDFLASSFKDIGLKATAMYETRDDSLMPGKGQLLDFSIRRNDEALGGKYNYTTYKAKALSFHPLGDRWVMGLRAEASAVTGEPPFYAVPWVTMRGIPAMRYQGDEVAMLELEMRFNINPDWALIGFGGEGWASSNLPGIETEQSIRAWGFGGRYKLLKSQEVWVGLDLARGPEERAVYVQVGHPW